MATTGHASADPATAAGSFTVQLTGVRIERNTRRWFKSSLLSRKLNIDVDGVGNYKLSRSCAIGSPWVWEVARETPIPITRKSVITISIQRLTVSWFGIRKEIQRFRTDGDAVYDPHVARTEQGHVDAPTDGKPDCIGFKMLLSFSRQENSRNANGSGRQAPMPEGNGQAVQDPCAPSTHFRECVTPLRNLLQPKQLFYSEFTPKVESALNTLQSACDLMSASDLGASDDIIRLGKQVHALLNFMQKPELLGLLNSPTQTVDDILDLVLNFAIFLEDYYDPNCDEDPANPNSRKRVIEDFNEQLSNVNNCLEIGKDVSVPSLPYTRLKDGIFSIGTEKQGGEGSAAILHRLEATLCPESMLIDSSHGPCLGETRKNILSTITDWSTNFSAPNVLWLCGAPGTGKTTISFSLIKTLRDQKRLAGVFIFRHQEDASFKLWPTLAYQMAQYHHTIASKIYSAMLPQKTDDKLDLSDVQSTFQRLIQKPLEGPNALLFDSGPVILIDAPEKCHQVEEKRSWQKLLNTLLLWLKLPRHCKLIITSPHQNDITKTFNGKDIKFVELLTGDDADKDTNTENDVRTYLDHHFTQMREYDNTLSDWPDSDTISKLVVHTRGFFKWAATAVDSIKESDKKREHLAAIVKNGTTMTFEDFDEYLEDVLELVSHGIHPDTFKTIMRMLAFRYEAPTLDELTHMLRYHPGVPVSSTEMSPEDTCSRLQQILSIGGGSTVKFRHSAYRDYLVDVDRCTLFDKGFRAETHHEMATSCLKVIVQELKFNICGINSSYQMNDKTKDALVRKNIPSYLAYACQYWADHLHEIASTQSDWNYRQIPSLLRIFFKFRLLHWLEALSLLSKSDIAPKALRVVAELKDLGGNLSLLAADASRFAVTFSGVISESVPHIYLSALPFAPPSSLVSKRYRHKFPRTIKVLHDEETNWPAIRFLVPTDKCVHGISIHPGGQRIAVAMGEDTAIVIAVASGYKLFDLSEHGGRVSAIEYSPQGEMIATGCEDGCLRVYESEIGVLRFKLRALHEATIRSIAWSPDGQQIATGSKDGKVQLVSTSKEEVIHTIDVHNDGICSVLLTRDFLILGSEDSVKIYDASAGSPLGEAQSTWQIDQSWAIAISPNEKILAAGGDDWYIQLYNMDKKPTNKQLIRGHDGPIRSLAFFNDGQLASGGEDKTVRLWDVETGKESCDPLHGHRSAVNSVKFSSDMKQLITGGEDCSIRFFDIDALPKKSARGKRQFNAAIPLRDGNTIIASDGLGISKWTVDTGRVVDVPFRSDSKRLADIQCISISSDGQLVATAAKSTVTIWKAESGEELWGLDGHSDSINALSFSADSNMVVSGSDDRTVCIWSTKTGEIIHGPMDGHKRSVTSVCFSPDGTQAASGSFDKSAIIWSVEAGEQVDNTITYHRAPIYGLAYSPQGRFLATASEDCIVAIWDLGTRDVLRPFKLMDHGEPVSLVSWSSDERKIVSGTEDNVIRIFDVETGALLYEPLASHQIYLVALSLRSSVHSDEPEVISVGSDGTVRVRELGMKSFVRTQPFPEPNVHNDWVQAVSFSPVNDHIASGGHDGCLVVIDVTTGSSKFSKQAHKSWIRCVKYSSDGKIATCSNDRTIKIWDAKNGEQLLGTLTGHSHEVLCVEFSPDGAFLVSGSKDETVRIWDVRLTSGEQRSRNGKNGAVNAVAYANEGKLIVWGSESGYIAVWDGGVRNEGMPQFGGHNGPILSICTSVVKVFSSSHDTIKIWELSTGNALNSIPHGHTAPIKAISLISNGEKIVSVSDDAILRIFDSDSGQQCTMPLRMPNRMLAVAVTVSRDGTLVACGGTDNSVHVWRTDMKRRSVWPDGFMRKTRGKKFCLVDERGILADIGPPGDDGWLYGPKEELLFWVPPDYRGRLQIPPTVGTLGELETIVDYRHFVHGTEWALCSQQPDLTIRPDTCN